MAGMAAVQRKAARLWDRGEAAAWFRQRGAPEAVQQGLDRFGGKLPYREKRQAVRQVFGRFEGKLLYMRSRPDMRVHPEQAAQQGKQGKWLQQQQQEEPNSKQSQQPEQQPKPLLLGCWRQHLLQGVPQSMVEAVEMVVEGGKCHRQSRKPGLQ